MKKTLREIHIILNTAANTWQYRLVIYRPLLHPADRRSEMKRLAKISVSLLLLKSTKSSCSVTFKRLIIKFYRLFNACNVPSSAKQKEMYSNVFGDKSRKCRKMSAG